MTTKCKHYPTAALQREYGGQNCTVIVKPKTVTPHNDGNLPFTGFDGGLILVVAVALVATGTALRRAARRVNPA